MNSFERRRLKEQREKDLIETKDQSKTWNKHGISYEEYRKIYQKWKLAVKRGHDVSIDFYIQHRKKKRIALYKKSPVSPLTTVLKKYNMTEEVRGLLCQYCNSGIGFFRDEAQTVLSAAEYLSIHASDNF
ncbi:MAG: hypothetical protein HC840_00475 [Leptolyngbyaceae cyanobacterium RM2_2_4]|nr:hypothetical protein [Leptolyngbyaceae cyanobacterium RM2_2_4]